MIWWCQKLFQLWLKRRRDLKPKRKFSALLRPQKTEPGQVSSGSEETGETCYTPPSHFPKSNSKSTIHEPASNSKKSVSPSSSVGALEETVSRNRTLIERAAGKETRAVSHISFNESQSSKSSREHFSRSWESSPAHTNHPVSPDNIR